MQKCYLEKSPFPCYILKAWIPPPESPLQAIELSIYAPLGFFTPRPYPQSAQDVIKTMLAALKQYGCCGFEGSFPPPSYDPALKKVKHVFKEALDPDSLWNTTIKLIAADLGAHETECPFDSKPYPEFLLFVDTTLMPIIQKALKPI